MSQHMMWMLLLVFIAALCGQITCSSESSSESSSDESNSDACPVCAACACSCTCSYPECPSCTFSYDTVADVDECTSNPCQHGSSCEDELNSYKCFCAPGYEGVNCQTDTDDCAGDPCQNGGTCTDGVYSHSCACLAGFTGDNCEDDVTECQSNPCQNGGMCQEGVNQYSCDCAEGFDGSHCEDDIDECEDAPCQNGGSCEDEAGSYKCYCTTGFAGDNCESGIDRCETNPCLNGGTCTDLDIGYKCMCPIGHAGHDCDVVAHVDCSAIYEADNNAEDGIFFIYPGRNHHPMSVYCQFDDETGGSIVFQRRQHNFPDNNVHEDFFRGWQEYKAGFGDMTGEFWLGNRALNRLTSEKNYNLRVDLKSEQGLIAYANYNWFRISGSSDKFRLSIGGYSGTAGDSLAYHNNMRFSTHDADHDFCSGTCNCAEWGKGGWWYNNCLYSNLNGEYLPNSIEWSSVCWWHFESNHNLDRSEMRLWRDPNAEQ